MNLTLLPTTTTALYSRASDRSRGDAGELLRNAIENAVRPPSPDRGEETCIRLTQALEKARQREGIFTSADTFSRMLDLLALLPRDIPLPEIVVESENEIGLDWDEGPGRVLSLTVRDTPMLGFAALLGVEPLHGRLRFAEEFPETLRFLLGRLYPSRR